MQLKMLYYKILYLHEGISKSGIEIHGFGLMYLNNEDNHGEINHPSPTPFYTLIFWFLFVSIDVILMNILIGLTSVTIFFLLNQLLDLLI